MPYKDPKSPAIKSNASIEEIRLVLKYMEEGNG